MTKGNLANDKLVLAKALIGSVWVSSSYEKLPSTLTQTEPIGQQVTSSGQLKFRDPKVIKKAEFGQGYQENGGNWGKMLTLPYRVNFGSVRVGLGYDFNSLNRVTRTEMRALSTGGGRNVGTWRNWCRYSVVFYLLGVDYQNKQMS